jgi:hypothetical protein
MRRHIFDSSRQSFIRGTSLSGLTDLVTRLGGDAAALLRRRSASRRLSAWIRTRALKGHGHDVVAGQGDLSTWVVKWLNTVSKG